MEPARHGVDLVAANIAPAHAVHFAQVMWLQAIRIDQCEVLASEAGKGSRYQGPCTPHPNERYAQAGQTLPGRSTAQSTNST